MRQAEIAQFWEVKRRRKLDDQALEHMDTDLHPQEDTLGELMRYLALVENMEDDSFSPFCRY